VDPFEVLEHRVAEDLGAVAGLVAVVAARLGAGRAEVDQLAGRPDGERPAEHLVEDREDGGVGADAERERQDGDRREAGVSHQQAQAERPVPQELRGPAGEPAAALDALVVLGAAPRARGLVAELAACLRARVVFAKARGDELGGAHVEVKPELLANLVAQLGARARREAEQPSETSASHRVHLT